MLCTALLESPPVDEKTAEQVGRFLKTRQGIDNQTGELEYNIVSGSLKGSWETSVAVNVRRQRIVSVNGPARVKSAVVKGSSPVEIKSDRPTNQLVDCPPYLTIEGSVHKAMMGHNVYGGPLCPVAGSRWFISNVAQRLGFSLPEADGWQYGRVDWARLFDLGSFEGCQEYVHLMRMADYSRRKSIPYGDESIMWPGTMTTPKIYHKGPEFSKHDFARLARVARLPERSEVRRVHHDLQFLEVVEAAVPFDVAAIQEQANRYLRFEVTVKAKKLKAEFDGKPAIVKVTREWLEALHDVETGRILSEGKADMETVRRHNEVNTRLHQLYDGALANRLFGMWMQLAALGEEEIKRQVKQGKIARRTYYWQREKLLDAGVTWDGADVKIMECASAIPKGFSLLGSSPFRLTAEAPEVVQALAPFRRAA